LLAIDVFDFERGVLLIIAIKLLGNVIEPCFYQLVSNAAGFRCFGKTQDRF